MCRVLVLGSIGIAACLLVATAAWAGKWSAADYPLRVHIFQFNSHSHYYRPGGAIYGSLENVDGEGRANLYENAQPKGFDFGYNCGTRIMVSPGFETYIARWQSYSLSWEASRER